MPDYRRYFVEGGTYFFTLVTAGREPLFRRAEARRVLGRSMREERQRSPFHVVAIVLLPDHLHAIWTLPTGDADYSDRWRAIKARFTSEWLRLGGEETRLSEGYRRQRRRGVWQPGFIEHMIRDELDLHRHADYIHLL
jgi:putative transposase